MSSKKCEICGKKGIRQNTTKRLFLARFPSDPDRCKKWVKAVGKEDLVYVPIEKLSSIRYVCKNHFEPTDFYRNEKRLKRTAVPSIDLQYKPLRDELLADFPLHIAKESKSCMGEHNYAYKHQTLETTCHGPESKPCFDEHNYASKHQILETCHSPEPCTSKMDVKHGYVSEKSCPSKLQEESETPVVQNIYDYEKSKPCLEEHNYDYKQQTLETTCHSPEPCTSKMDVKHVSEKSCPSKLQEERETPVIQNIIHDYEKSCPLKLQEERETPVVQNIIYDYEKSCPSKLQKERETPVIQNIIHDYEREEASKISRETRKMSPIPSTSRINDDNEKTTESKPTSVNPKSNRPLLASPRKLKLIKKIKKIQIENRCLKKKVKNIESIESPLLSSLIQSSIKNKRRQAHGKRWTKLNKSVAIAIYKKSPKSYRYLSQLLPMPSIRTLQITLEKMKMEPGIDSVIIEHLKRKAEQLSEKEKHCVILFDEMALKKRLIYNQSIDLIDGYEDLGDSGGRSGRIADHALVFMLQGIYKKFKQPISYYFVKGTISTNSLGKIIETVITCINEIGYKVVATVCDQGPTNVGALNLLKRNNDLPPAHNYFFINREKIFIIFDVPHLFKSIRNNFFQGGVMILNNKKAQWCHLIKLEEKNRMKLRFTKISKLHVAPKFRSKMKVKIAAQILSNTVAAILKLMAESLENKEESDALLETAEVVEELDKLFDCTNGPGSKHDFKKNRRANVRENSFHHKLWPKYLTLLKTVTFYKTDNCTKLKNVRCINGYLITLKSLQAIWDHVASIGFKFLNLRQLNQDALENLFGIIRQHSPTNRNPTCHHFKGALKSSILTRLSTPLSKGSNCEKDDNEIVFDFNDIVFPAATIKVEQLNNPETHGSVTTENIPLIEIPEIEKTEKQLHEIDDFFKSFEKQPTVYVSGYLARAIVTVSSCEECHHCLTVSRPEQHSIYSYILLKEYWQDKESLTYPTIKLCETVDLATSVFEREVIPCFHRKDICLFTKTMMSLSCDFTWTCEEHRPFIVDDLIQRLSLLLIRNECKTINRSFSMSEEKVADAIKKAEQQGTAK